MKFVIFSVLLNFKRKILQWGKHLFTNHVWSICVCVYRTAEALIAVRQCQGTRDRVQTSYIALQLRSIRVCMETESEKQRARDLTGKESEFDSCQFSVALRQNAAVECSDQAMDWTTVPVTQGFPLSLRRYVPWGRLNLLSQWVPGAPGSGVKPSTVYVPRLTMRGAVPSLPQTSPFLLFPVLLQWNLKLFYERPVCNQ